VARRALLGKRNNDVPHRAVKVMLLRIFATQ
jgi:hypothetical protein